MAWTDAAREAALAARKLHAKTEYHFGYSHDTSARGRKIMAGHLRDIRAGKFHGAWANAEAAMRHAVSSTHFRNYERHVARTIANRTWTKK